MRISNFSLILVSAMLGCVGTSLRAADAKGVLYVEIRCPKAIEIKSNTGVYSGLNFRTDHTTEGTPLSLTKQREDGDFRVFQQSYKLKSERARAVIVTPWNQIDQVFVLSLPLKLKQSDWTNWQHADYVETNAVSNFRFAYIPPDRSTNIPPNSFEMRYRVELP
jgi:hypothetical protein